MNADKALELARLAYPNDENLRVAYMLGLNAGAEWQKNQMPMPEDTVLFNKGVAEGRRLEREDMMKDGNVVLAEEDFDAEKEKSMEWGYNLCKEQMLKDAVEGYVNYYEDSGGILMAEAQVGCPYHNGDKVRIVVLKAEEEN